MQKAGTLGLNRSKEDYLLQPFQNGKLHMINIPLPRDGGKGPFQNKTKRNFLLDMLIALEVELFFCLKIWGSVLNGKDADGYCSLVRGKVMGKEKLNMYGLWTKCEVKMAGYWPSSFLACLWTETESRSINSQKKERGQYPAILTEQAWSIKDLLYGFRGNFSRGTRRVVPSG